MWAWQATESRREPTPKSASDPHLYTVAWWHIPFTRALGWGGRGKRIPGIHWPAPRFSKRPWFKIKVEIGRGRYPVSVSGFCTRAHAHAYTYTHTNTCVYIYTTYKQLTDSCRCRTVVECEWVLHWRPRIQSWFSKNWWKNTLSLLQTKNHTL